MGTVNVLMSVCDLGNITATLHLWNTVRFLIIENILIGSCILYLD